MASFPEQKRAFIFEEVFDQFIDLAKNTNGLCVVKKLVQLMKNSDQAEVLLKKLQENAIDLVQDPYGNYAVTELILVRILSIFTYLEMGFKCLQTYL
jgi:hypothetical protein